MRPAPLDIQTQGSLGGKRIEMTMDMHSVQFAMSTLTNLYSDPIKAIIREYSTNALDAHAMIGNTAPIEIHAPNQLSPFFKIRDFGPGMSVDFIENVYSQYWNSTKRESDTQVGMLGLGSKSGLTYTAQFQVISIHNGVKIYVMVSKSEDGSGAMEIVDTVATDEPSGVEVIIPVKYTDEFANKVHAFFKYWKPGTVLVDDKAPDFVGDEAGNFWINDEILVIPNQGDSYVVMGNVPYRAEGLVGPYASYRLVAFVPIGSVAFPPNREELMYTESTKATIARVRKDAQDGITEQIQEEIDSANSYLEALEIHENRKGIVKAEYTYDGETLVETWFYNTKNDPDELMSFYHTHERNAVSSPQYVGWKEFRDHLTITGFTDEKLTTTQRRKIRQYIVGISERKPYKVYLMAKHPDSVRLDGIRTVDWSVIHALKLPKPERSPGKPMEANALNASGWFQTTKSLDPTKKVLYIAPGRRKIKWSVFQDMLGEFEIVSMYKNEIPRFLKAYPHAEEFELWIRDNLRYAVAGLTNTDKIQMTSIDYYSKRVAERLDETRIDDPEMVAFIKRCKNNTYLTSDTIKEYHQAVSYAKAIDYQSGRVVLNDLEDPLNKYPLAKHNQGYSEHITIYMNAIYNKESNEVQPN